MTDLTLSTDTTFTIGFNFDSSVTQALKTVFENAAARWQSIITSDIPNYAGVVMSPFP